MDGEIANMRTGRHARRKAESRAQGARKISNKGGARQGLSKVCHVKGVSRLQVGHADSRSWTGLRTVFCVVVLVRCEQTNIPRASRARQRTPKTATHHPPRALPRTGLSTSTRQTPCQCCVLLPVAPCLLRCHGLRRQPTKICHRRHRVRRVRPSRLLCREGPST